MYYITTSEENRKDQFPVSPRSLNLTCCYLLEIVNNCLEMFAAYYEEIVNYLKEVKMLDDVDNDDDVETEVDVDTLLSKAHHRISIELNLNFFRQKKY